MNMKLKTLILLLILTPTIYFSCKDNNESKGLIDISGVTELNESADNIGNIDATDWKFTDSWSLNEENLFKKNNSTNTVTETIRPNTSVVVIGYPNPAKDILFLAFQLESSMYYDLRIVDNNMNIKFQLDSAKNSMKVRDSAYVNNELYRAYYKIYSDNKVYRGHGDFKFIK